MSAPRGLGLQAPLQCAGAAPARPEPVAGEDALSSLPSPLLLHVAMHVGCEKHQPSWQPQHLCRLRAVNRRLRTLVNQQGWRLAAESHFPDALEVLRADCAMDLDAQPQIWWEQLYHFLTRVRSTLPGESSLNWYVFRETAPLGPPLRSPAPVLYCRPARSSNTAGGPPPTPKLYLRRPMLMAEADWHQGTDEMDVRRITVYVSWRAYCPSFPRSKMWARLFAALPAPQPLMGHTLQASVRLQQCPYCSARLVELAEPEPHDGTRWSWFTPDFEELLLAPVRDALPEEGLDEPPLYGSLADDEEWTRDTHALVVCASGHFLFAETWPMVDREACEELASDDGDEDEDEYYGGGRCAYLGHYSGMGHFAY